jgi:UDP-glucose 4-epimerase
MAKQLWGYTLIDAAARACLQSLTANFRGHEVFQIMAAETVVETPSLELAQQHFPQVPIRGDLHGRRGLYDCSKAERLLGWQHE